MPRAKLAGWTALILIVAAAAYLRFRGLAHSPISGDQSVLLNIAMRWVRQGAPMFPQAANKSSAGIMNPPLIEYLLAAPLFLRSSLWDAHGFQALLSTSAVLALYLYARPQFGERVALVAALLFAVNPWAVYYGRFIWNPNPIPFFSTLLLMSLLAYFAGDGRSRHLALSGLWLAAITQLHLGSLVLVPVVILIVLIFWRRWWHGWQWRTAAPFAAGLGLATLLYWPYFRFERAVGFTDLRAMAGALTGVRLTRNAVVGVAETNLASWLLTLELGSGSHIFSATGLPKNAVWSGHWVSGMAQVLLIFALLFAAVVVFLAIRHRRKQPPSARQKAIAILLIWILLPVILYLRHTVYLQNYYFLALFPAPFLLMAIMSESAGERLGQAVAGMSSSSWSRMAGLTLPLALAPLLLVALWQFHLGHRRLVLLDEGLISTKRPLADIDQLITISHQLSARYPSCEFVLVDEGGTPESSRLGLLEPFLFPVQVRLLDEGRGYIIPEDCALYVSSAREGLVADWLAIAGTPIDRVTVGPDETWQFWHVDSSPRTESAVIAAWDNGLTLTDKAFSGSPRAGERLTVTYSWQVGQPLTHGVQYHFFNHFTDETGQIVAQEDTPAIASTYWRPGDRMVTQFYLQMPPELATGTYHLYIGLYSWPDLARVQRHNAETMLLVETFEIP